ncbi:unnamed protein product [Ilex paraguariensis]|uniref:Uncharacterized protein n=1 Tax=Ilex paraguariensis TaxID=185542 RepID=A0ABC8R7W0_9AQUA
MHDQIISSSSSFLLLLILFHLSIFLFSSLSSSIVDSLPFFFFSCFLSPCSFACSSLLCLCLFWSLYGLDVGSETQLLFELWKQVFFYSSKHEICSCSSNSHVTCRILRTQLLVLTRF